MTKVEIDDLDCPYCKKTTIGELDIKTNKGTQFSIVFKEQ